MGLRDYGPGESHSPVVRGPVVRFLSVRSIRREFVGLGHLETGGFVLDGAEVVAVGKGLAARRANNLVSQISLNLVVFDLGIVSLLGFERPGLDGPVDLTQVADTGIHLRCAAGFNEVWDSDGCQQTNNSHDDHDLDERESPLPG